MDRVYKIVLLIIFIIALYALTILNFLFPYSNESNHENRNLALKPRFSLKKISSYPKDYDDYYNDNLPYRNLMINNWRNIYYHTFKESLDDRVLIGKNEKNETWLFYDNVMDGDPISFIDGRKMVNEDQINIIADGMIEQTNKLKDHNIDLYYIIAPNKSSVYSRYLPHNINIAEDYFDKVDRIIKNKGINNLYYNLKLLRENGNNYETYYRTDTHWNEYGSYLYVKDIVNGIYNKEIFKDEDIEQEITDSNGKDIHYFSGLSFDIKDTITKVNYSAKDDITPKVIGEEPKQIEIYENPNYEIDEVVMVIGDSYTTVSTQYFASIYKKVIKLRLRGDNYDTSIIDKYNPSKIFYIRVERSTPFALEFKFMQ